MEWIAGLDFEKIANAIVILVAGLAAGLGFRTGKKTPTPAAESTVAVAGALVDSGSVKLLSAAIEAATLEAVTRRQFDTKIEEARSIDDEKLRKLGYRMVEAVEEQATELHELRSELRVLGDRVGGRR